EVGQVAEGVNTLRLVKAKADELGVYMPLVSGLHLVLEDPSRIDVVTRGLMMGTSKRDVEFAVPGLRD
ncbi:MAG: glycerol-3-phosphate dehydrogenase, partial [Pseudomonadota bacterium]|nr:glycerol-3-phosphate dehydrogenase [Pseudomonadota bacterium]